MAEPEQTAVDERQERLRAYQREWKKAQYRANPDKMREELRKRYHARPHSVWSEDEKKRHRERGRKHYQEHREQESQRSAAYNRKVRAQNPEAVNERMREWHRLHPWKHHQYNSRRRALELAATVNLLAIEAWMRAVKSKPFAHCYYCGSRISTGRIHFDHIVPLSCGGPHCVENLAVSCAPCNQSKNAKMLKEWQCAGQRMLGL